MAMHRPSKYPALKLSLSLSFFYFYLKLCTTYILHTKQNTNDRHRNRKLFCEDSQEAPFNEELGLFLGRLLFSRVVLAELLSKIQIVIMHSKKVRKRWRIIKQRVFWQHRD